MAIISFEEMENVNLEETSELDQTNTLIDVAEKAETELNAIDGLDEAIAKQDQIIANFEEKEESGDLSVKDVEDLKEEVVDNVVATESYLTTIFGAGNKQISKIYGYGFSFESINSDPFTAMKQHNAMLKSLRAKITDDSINAIREKQNEAIRALNK